jgi:hypothetical protein
MAMMKEEFSFAVVSPHQSQPCRHMRSSCRSRQAITCVALENAALNELTK